MSETLSFAPILPILWLAILLGAASITTLWAGWRRPVWTALRLLLIALIGFVAMGPQRIRAEREYLNDIALLVVDDSQSMLMGERAAIRDKAAAQIRQLAENDPELDLLEVHVSDHPDGTRLLETLEQGLSQIPAERLAGVIALSDGIVHDETSTPTLNAPFHGLITGDMNRGDRALTVIEAPKFGFVGEDILFKIRVDDFGQAGTGNALVTLQLAGEPPVQANVQTGIEVTVSLPLGRRGTNLVELKVASASEELTLINNRAAVEVTGVRERLRVLLVSGEPYAGVRAWRNLLKSDPAVDLVHFTILRPPTKRDATPLQEMALIAFPTRELFVNKLDSFDLVIFDRYTRRGVLPLLYLENVTRYVENGGALMVAAGPPFAGPGSLAKTFLAGILPARPNDQIKDQPYRPTITDLGLRHPVVGPLAAQQENWGRWGRVIGVTGATGETVLATEDKDPLLILNRVGEGRVALLLSDQAWLWSRGFEGGGPQYELYRRLAHWLMKEPDLEEESLRGQIEGDQLRVQLQTLSDAPEPVEIEQADGTIARLAVTQTRPGLFTGSMKIDPNIGMLSLRSGPLLAVAAQGRLNPPELEHLMPTPDLLAPLSAQTGGGIVQLGNPASNFAVRRTRPQDRQAGRGWIGLQRNRFSLATHIEREDLFPKWVYLLLTLLLIGGMWFREAKS
jgi:hypothetical protein